MRLGRAPFSLFDYGAAANRVGGWLLAASFFFAPGDKLVA